MPIARGSVLGFIIGIIPGSAHIISSFMSYALEKRISKHPEEFGKGAVAGVAGPESANNAASTGAFVPMLALGIPTGPVTAVLIAALLIHGVPPGPTLVNDHPKVFWGFVASMYVGNLMLLALNLPLVGLFVNLLRIPYAYLYPLIIMFCVIGVYEVNHSIVDVWIMLIMGVVGYGLKKFGFDPAPLVLGLVIAPIFEMSLRQSLIMSDGTWLIFLQRPIAADAARDLRRSAGAVGVSPRMARRDWRAKLAEAEAAERADRPAAILHTRPKSEDQGGRHGNSPPSISAARGERRRAGGRAAIRPRAGLSVAAHLAHGLRRRRRRARHHRPPDRPRRCRSGSASPSSSTTGRAAAAISPCRRSRARRRTGTRCCSLPRRTPST